MSFMIDRQSWMRFIRLDRQRELLSSPRVRLAALVLGCTLIVAWQFGLLTAAATHDPKWRVTSATGLHNENEFVYFYYYLDYFPVATTTPPTDYSREGARRLIAEHGESLQNEFGHTIRSGDWGRVWLYLPHAWITGTAQWPSTRTATGLLFTASLLALYVAFWARGLALLGLLGAALIGSHPLQLYEAYTRENIFSLPISAAVLMLALHLPFLDSRKPNPRLIWLTPLLGGVFLATLRQVRLESALIVASCFLAALLAPNLRCRARAALAALLIMTFVATSLFWSDYFARKQNEAESVVRQAGGRIFPNPFLRYHHFWQPLWCGLGDFGQDKGFSWNDRDMAAYARPIIENRYGEKPPAWSGENNVYENDPWDAEGRFYRVIYELPHMEEVLRDNVVSTISADPSWYAGILLSRIERTLSEVAPVGLAAGERHARASVGGWWGLAALGLALWGRSRLAAGLLLFTLPLAFTSILIYSGGGNTYYSIYPMLGAALVLAWLLEGALWWIDRRRRRRKGEAAS